ncbi:hypothetical protein HPP92_028732 [Vanilla planifolia]|uniref:Uncharacterized protein n=1 Tax=Vanilla planifolia TaxID=51239 RepID=A0A835U2R1_VANPL|nr:hypothetical protein HPP92_028732 [Vanilla planifolia]KAG0446678.1 hypothetical protein HPP92_028720 [Vanilla planifolia]
MVKEGTSQSRWRNRKAEKKSLMLKVFKGKIYKLWLNSGFRRKRMRGLRRPPQQQVCTITVQKHLKIQCRHPMAHRLWFLKTSGAMTIFCSPLQSLLHLEVACKGATICFEQVGCSVAIACPIFLLQSLFI